MNNITNFEDEEVFKHIRKLRELNWPSKNFIRNISNINVIKLETEEDINRFTETINKDKEFMKNNIYYSDTNKTYLRTNFLYFSTKKTLEEDSELIEYYINNNSDIYNLDGFVSLATATNIYLQSIMYKNDETPSIYPNGFLYTTAIMCLLINKIGMNNFVRKYFDSDYSCLTSDIKNILGPKLTKELYDYAIFDNRKKGNEIPTEIIMKFGPGNSKAMQEIHDIIEKGVIYALGEEEYYKKRNEIQIEGKVLNNFNIVKRLRDKNGRNK